MGTAFRIPDGRTRLVLDVLLVIWVVAWILVGLKVGREVRGLSDLSRTTVAAGLALEEAGGALSALDGVPLVGEDIDEIGERTRRAGASARASGRSSRESIDDLSLLLALSVALIPSLPLAALYLPLRISWARQVRGVRGAIRRRPDDAHLREFLARRAAQNLPYRALYEASDDPWGDLEAERWEPLANAELRRLGLRHRLPSSQSHER